MDFNASSLLSSYASFLKSGGLIPYFAKGLDYLTRGVLGAPPETTGVGNPYVPPFTGGQCNKAYRVSVWFKQGNVEYLEDRYFNGAIGGVQGATGNWYIVFNNGSQQAQISSSVKPEIRGVYALDGVDNCGNLPNPNPPALPNETGLAYSDPPSFSGSGSSVIIDGVPLADDGSSGLLDAASTDLSAAGDLAPSDPSGALAKVALALAALIEYLKLLKDVLDLLKKLLNKDNKESFSHDFGNLTRDGFITLLPEPRPKNVEAVYLDLQVTEVKIGIGRLFGQKSPHYYAFEPIGRISFVSSTFGVMETVEVRFIRTSIPIPSLAYGFFYHFGLDGVNKANASGFYVKQVE